MLIYDYVIAGSGASGLMLAYRMSQDDFFSNKAILILDKENKDSNDRTWCYWEKGRGEWDFLLSKSWDTIYFGSRDYSDTIDLDGYSYKMLRSKDFYGFVKEEISKKTNFRFEKEEILNIEDNGLSVKITTKTKEYISNKVLSSIFDPEIIKSKPSFVYLKQHFVGWFVRTDSPVFNPDVAGFMDFDIPQKGNTRFMYVLPTSHHEALIEYTLFSETLLSFDQYEQEIASYMNARYAGVKYEIVEKENGNIPMTCFPFQRQNTKNLMYIGSAGGWTKASTGFTFANSLRISLKLVSFLKKESDFTSFRLKNRYWYYDLIFLNVLHKHNEAGSTVFASIFKNNNIKDVFTFLDEKGTFWKDLKIMFRTQPKVMFIMSAFRSIKNMFKG